MPDAVGALEVAQLVLLVHRLRVAEVLDDLQRVAQREHLAAVDVLQVVGQRLEVTAVPNGGPEGVATGLGLDGGQVRADLGQAGLDLGPIALQLLVHSEATDLVRLSQHEPYDDQVVGRAVHGVTGGVGTPVLHGLEHRGQFGADVGRTVAMDDAGDAAHRGLLLSRIALWSVPSGCGQGPKQAPGNWPYGRMSRYSSTSQSVTVAMKRSHSSRL